MNDGMNNSKTIHITYGAIIFIILGLVAVAFFIWYPLQDTKTATADIGDLPDPATFLYGSDLNSFNSIEQHAREHLVNEALPQLIKEVMEPGQQPTEADVEFLTTKLVRLFKQTHDEIEDQRNRMASTQSLGSPCSYTSTLYSYNNRVVISQHSQCDAQMASMTSGARLRSPDGDTGSWRIEQRFHTKSTSISTSRAHQSGCWVGWGTGSATPENDGPNPSPGAGDQQHRSCY